MALRRYCKSNSNFTSCENQYGPGVCVELLLLHHVVLLLFFAITTCIPRYSSVVVARAASSLFAIQVSVFLACMQEKTIRLGSCIVVIFHSTLARIRRWNGLLLATYIVRGSIPLFHRILKTKAAISATTKIIPAANSSVVSIPKTMQKERM